MPITKLADQLGSKTADFMEPDVFEDDWYTVETNEGTELVPASVAGQGITNAYDLQDYLSGTPRDESVEVQHGWGGRMSAPGYMDATDYTGVFNSEQEAIDALNDMYGDDF